MASVAERLKEALTIRNLKQSDIVKLTGIGKSSISTYLTGEYEPKQKNIYKLAKALNVSESWLMGNDVPMERITVSSHTQPHILDYYNKLNDIGKQEATERVKELTYIPKYSNLGLQAAHNDNINDEGELDKINNDMTKLKRPN